ncbi:hypothetical protein E2562_009832 [Oryza meyeriana var. granulata]|uniref:Uncharacterized protein n=1 Tax=Oryza meyeriana var. granulata TaxID=110450 RepID=A0A6G1BVH8_9ORYZ|nr:hypothetical protein E2562_009832 [Oryza meyeriana var. granulata]
MPKAPALAGILKALPAPPTTETSKPQKFSLGHKCAAKGAYWVELAKDSDDDDSAENTIDIQVSLLALADIRTGPTMQLPMEIKGKRLSP